MNKKLIFVALLVSLLLVVVVGVAFGQNSPSIRWEYQAINISRGINIERLNELGGEGWELVTSAETSSSASYTLIFKRRLP